MQHSKCTMHANALANNGNPVPCQARVRAGQAAHEARRASAAVVQCTLRMHAWHASVWMSASTRTHHSTWQHMKRPQAR